jgi:hypothetical protein
MATMFTSFRFVNRFTRPATDVKLLSAGAKDPIAERCSFGRVYPGEGQECDPKAQDQIYVFVSVMVDDVLKSQGRVAPPKLYFKSLLVELDPASNLILTPILGPDQDAKR